MLLMEERHLCICSIICMSHLNQLLFISGAIYNHSDLYFTNDNKPENRFCLIDQEGSA